MKETDSQIKIHALLHRAVYFIVIIECLLLFLNKTDILIIDRLLSVFKNMFFLKIPNVKFLELFILVIVSIGTKPKKKIEVNIAKEITIPLVLGLFLMFIPLSFVDLARSTKNDITNYLNIYSLLYILSSILGIAFSINGITSIFKLIQNSLGKDRFNIEQESFQQETEKIETPYSINIPTRFYYQKKWNNGWLNIDPFRGTFVIGTPGSGKTFNIINPAIRQFINKGFSLLIYDLKYSALAEIAYLHYLRKKAEDENYKHKFHVINPQNVEQSVRVNPIKSSYIENLAQANNMAESIVLALQKGGGSGGSSQFFTQSAINFLAACLYFLVKYEDGKNCSLPHLMSLITRSYDEIFTLLFKEEELISLLSPFKSAYVNKSFDQLEGQIGTLKIFISKLASKESYWVFTEDDNEEEINLKISDKNDPSIIVLASSPQAQNINSAIFSAIINQTITQINEKNNLPSAVIADEFPTVYFHDIEQTIATARSNKVAVMLGLQELTQLRQYYKKEVADTLPSIVGNVISGSVRDKNTLTWIEGLIGKAKQISHSMSVSENGTTINTNEKIDFLVPQAKIANLKTGQLVGVLADSEIQKEGASQERRNLFNANISVNLKEIKEEEKSYLKIPIYYEFIDDELRNNLIVAEEEKNLLSNKLSKMKKNNPNYDKVKDLYFDASIKLDEFRQKKENVIDSVLIPNFNKINNDIEKMVSE